MQNIISNNTRLQTLFKNIKNDVSEIALFGSYLTNPAKANDIDLLVWCNKQDYTKLKRKIIKLQIDKLYLEPLQCTYSAIPSIPPKKDNGNGKTGGPPISTNNEKDFIIPEDIPIHISSLPIEKGIYEKTPLWKVNKKNLQYLT